MLPLLVFSVLFALGVYRFFPRIAKAFVGLTLVAGLAVAGGIGYHIYSYSQEQAQREAQRRAQLEADLFGTATADEAAQRLAALRQQYGADPVPTFQPVPASSEGASSSSSTPLAVRLAPFLFTVWWFWKYPDGRPTRRPRVEVEPVPGTWVIPAQPRTRALTVVPTLPVSPLTAPPDPAWSAILRNARDHVRFWQDNVRAHPQRADYRAELERAELTLATHLRYGGPG